MPEKDKVRTETKNLPLVPSSQLARDEELHPDQIWEGDELGAHFRVAKMSYPHMRGKVLYSVMIEGLELGKQKIRDDFINVLGTSFTLRDTLAVDKTGRVINATLILWESAAVDKRLNQKS